MKVGLSLSMSSTLKESEESSPAMSSNCLYLAGSGPNPTNGDGMGVDEDDNVWVGFTVGGDFGVEDDGAF